METGSHIITRTGFPRNPLEFILALKINLCLLSARGPGRHYRSRPGSLQSRAIPLSRKWHRYHNRLCQRALHLISGLNAGVATHRQPLKTTATTTTAMGSELNICVCMPWGP